MAEEPIEVVATPIEPTTNRQKAAAIIAAVLAILQAAGLCGLSVSQYTTFLDGKEQLVVGILAGVIGLIQTFVPALRPRHAAAAVKTAVQKTSVLLLVVFALFACLMVTACAGWRPTLTGASYTGPTADATISFDGSTSSTLFVQADVYRKDGKYPEIEFEVNRPSPAHGQLKARVPLK